MLYFSNQNFRLHFPPYHSPSPKNDRVALMWGYKAFLTEAFCSFTPISINDVGSNFESYATRANGSVGRNRGRLHVLNTNET